MYLNTANSDVYSFVGSAWVFQENIKGATGATGAAGADGATGATGATGPTGPPGSYTYSTLTWGATTNIDFDADSYRTLTLAGNTTFTTSNKGAPKADTIRIIGDSVQRTLTFPAGWQWATTKPTALAGSTNAILSITCFGTTDADLVACYALLA
jgi:hypothetical protein